MSFSAFVLFFCIILWLSFGPKWLLHKVYSKKDSSSFYSALYKFRYALPILTTYLIMALLKIVFQYLEGNG